jgi:hypothetical protein
MQTLVPTMSTVVTPARVARPLPDHGVQDLRVPARNADAGIYSQVVIWDGSRGTEGPPRGFRVDRPAGMSGSAMFSLEQLAAARSAIGPGLHVTVVDARREPHGLINQGEAVSLYATLDSAHSGLPKADIEADNQAWLLSLMSAGHTSVTTRAAFKAHDPGSDATNVQVSTSMTERQAVESLGMTYLPLFTPDYMRPDDESVDTVVDMAKAPAADAWLHFHCAEGHGRTTTLMVMWEMLRTGVDLDTAMRDQVKIGGHDLTRLPAAEPRHTWEGDRLVFLQRFAEYVQEQRTGGFPVKWSEWAAAKGWAYQPPGCYEV